MQLDDIPRATYRFQFNKSFRFSDATALVPYLESLGISHLYASPIFRSSPGSVHGYDVCDYNQFNPELGSPADFQKLCDALQDRKIFLLLDFVPNHMGVSGLENRWWADVMLRGKESRYAKYFDIDWKPLKRELENKVLLPFLADQYGRVLARGELQIVWQDGAFFVVYPGGRLPLSRASSFPLLEEAIQIANLFSEERKALLDELVSQKGGASASSQPVGLADPDAGYGFLSQAGREGGALHRAIATVLKNLQPDLDRLDVILSVQSYRLSYWKTAADEINYRRFFDVNSLAALRMEEPEVFIDTHRLLLELVSRPVVAGVRLDHIDGLALPRAYLEKLRELIEQRPTGERGTGSYAKWLLVEKILADGEELPASWPVHGTTGYEFATDVTALQVDSQAEKIITEGYHSFIQQKHRFEDLVYRGKRLSTTVSMAGEINILGHLLNRLSESSRFYRDFTLNTLTGVVREVTACFPIYRSYIEPEKVVAESDCATITRAILMARKRNPEMDHSAFAFLRDVLIPKADSPRFDEELRYKFVLKFQQNTSPVMAKGVEDTTFYRYNRFVALNEVGSHPEKFGISLGEFHLHNQKRLSTQPFCLLATSTHDTKRSEDVRARLAVLSEIPAVWIEAVNRWRDLNKGFHMKVEGEMAPDFNEEYLLYQTLVGSWPFEEMTAQAHEVYVKRIRSYMTKAIHEAKVNSGWNDPTEEWDEAVREFVSQILKFGSDNPFILELQTIVDRIAFPGVINSLSQVVLKLTAPGVPDFYQGTEFWDWSLVDPDNRRPVDYEKRVAALGNLQKQTSPRELLKNWRKSDVKLYVIHCLLRLRRDYPKLFAYGLYRPVNVIGEKRNCFIAFERHWEGKTLLVIVPRFSTFLGEFDRGWEFGDTSLENESFDAPNLFCPKKVTGNRLQSLLTDFPVVACFSER